MTVQLELDFLPAYLEAAISELHDFAVSVSQLPFNQNQILVYRDMERQASDLKHYAFLHNFIDWNQYEHFSTLMDKSSVIFWSV